MVMMGLEMVAWNPGRRDARNSECWFCNIPLGLRGEQIHRSRCYRGVVTDSPMGGTFWRAQERFYVGDLHPFPSSSSPPPCEVVHRLCHLLQLGLCSPLGGGGGGGESQGRCGSLCLICRQKNRSMGKESIHFATISGERVIPLRPHLPIRMAVCPPNWSEHTPFQLPSWWRQTKAPDISSALAMDGSRWRISRRCWVM